MTTVGGIVCATKLKTQPHLVKKYANRSSLQLSYSPALLLGTWHSEDNTEISAESVGRGEHTDKSRGLCERFSRC